MLPYGKQQGQSEAFVIQELVIGRSLGISWQHLQLCGSVSIGPKCLRP